MSLSKNSFSITTHVNWFIDSIQFVLESFTLGVLLCFLPLSLPMLRTDEAVTLPWPGTPLPSMPRPPRLADVA